MVALLTGRSWGIGRHDEATRTALLHLMVKFGLILQLKDGQYFVPSLLPAALQDAGATGVGTGEAAHTFRVAFSARAADAAEVLMDMPKLSKHVRPPC
jgi:hypothetical protein